MLSVRDGILEYLIVDDQNHMTVKCGSCGRKVRVNLDRVAGLKTYDCARCRQRAVNSVRPSESSVDSDRVTWETNALFARILAELTDVQRSMLIRKIAGFTDNELRAQYGDQADELATVITHLTNRIRSVR